MRVNLNSFEKGEFNNQKTIMLKVFSDVFRLLLIHRSDKSGSTIRIHYKLGVHSFRDPKNLVSSHIEPKFALETLIHRAELKRQTR